ncbi:MAG TPA: hypothetical protein VJK31_01925, partial [Chthoniobacterales bacterium]|nr:hypothetical protein [Chthoniobacterales bacterium]
SREGKHFRHAGSAVAESRPIFTAAVVLLGSLITRTRRQATRHYLLFRWSIARSQVTRHCVLRALIQPDSIGQAIVEKIALLGRG